MPDDRKRPRQDAGLPPPSSSFGSDDGDDDDLPARLALTSLPASSPPPPASLARSSLLPRAFQNNNNNNNLDDDDDDDDDISSSENEINNEDDDDIIAALENANDNDNDDDDDDDANGIDLFGSDMARDYAGNSRLDQYDARNIDDRVYSELDVDERAAVEAKLRRRDVLEGRLPALFLDDDDGDDARRLTTDGVLRSDDIDALQLGHRQRQRRRRRRAARRHDNDDIDDIDDAMSDDIMMGGPDMLLESLNDLKGRSIAEWLAMDRARNSVKAEFRSFLLGYIDDRGNSVYGDRIRNMCERSGESLEVSFRHLEDANAILAYLLSNSPAEMLDLFDSVALEAVQINFEAYARARPTIHVRMTDLPVVLSIRELREHHLNSLVRISGVVTRRTGVFPQLKLVKFDCVKCGTIIGPIAQEAASEVRVRACPNCMSKGPFNLNSEQTVYRNFQRLTLQETPGTVPAGRLPRHRDIVLLWDLVDSARPGDEVEITGIYRHSFDARLNTRMGFPVFSTIVEANHLSKRGDEFAALRLTTDDMSRIRALARDPMIARRIMRSIAPSIYGHDNIKTAIALTLFGGVAKNVNNKHRIRGDINILLLGDPGTAKSQFLKYIEKTCHRAVFTTGQGASAVGLTAAVRKDPVSREWTLEGGALVLADKGVCLIDEFDKMNDADRTSIHEAMEQQSISISKAGIVTSLHARCAIIAAANPLRGRYNAQLPFSQNVDLTEPILSRFDVLCVIRDRADPVEDEMLADFVLNSHVRSHPQSSSNNTDMASDANASQSQQQADDGDVANVTAAAASAFDASLIPQELLKKYIMYARDNIVPRLQEMDEDKLSRLYAELRRESLQTGSIPITVRHLESVIRMAEAHARMHLREIVRSDDIDVAIGVALDSFIGAQKYTVMRQLRRAFAKYIRTHGDNDALLLHALNGLVRDSVRLYQLSHNSGLPPRVTVFADDLATRAREMNIHNIEPFLASRAFVSHGYSVDFTFSEKRGRRRVIMRSM